MKHLSKIWTGACLLFHHLFFQLKILIAEYWNLNSILLLLDVHLKCLNSHCLIFHFIMASFCMKKNSKKKTGTFMYCILIMAIPQIGKLPRMLWALIHPPYQTTPDQMLAFQLCSENNLDGPFPLCSENSMIFFSKNNLNVELLNHNWCFHFGCPYQMRSGLYIGSDSKCGYTALRGKALTSISRSRDVLFDLIAQVVLFIIEDCKILRDLRFCLVLYVQKFPKILWIVWWYHGL